MDTIDLLFKQKVIREGLYTESIRKRILAKNSVLNVKILPNHTVTLMIALEDLEDLHPISLYQINALASSPKLKAIFRLKKKSELITEKYPNITQKDQYFD